MQRLLYRFSQGGAATSRSATASVGIARLVFDPLLMTIVLFVATAFAIYPRHVFELFFFYLSLGPGSLAVLLPILTVQAIRESPASPLAGLIRRLRQLPLRFYVTIGCVILFLSAFTAFKINIPMVVPFYADPWFADADRFLHGTDPWRLARSLPGVTSIVVDFVYSRLWFGVALGGLVYAALSGGSAEFRRLAWATMLAYLLLGVVSATLLSSVGPVFYDRFYPGDRFADLVAALAADPNATTQKAFVDYLFQAAQSRSIGIGTGISAMPSMHVAVAVLTAWYLTSLGPRRALAGWAFAGVILFGSVYTGWHYALDGYVSILVATLLWYVLSRLYRLPLRPLRT
jgi:membrane-associated phospholipid phosphatase